MRSRSSQAGPVTPLPNRASRKPWQGQSQVRAGVTLTKGAQERIVASILDDRDRRLATSQLMCPADPTRADAPVTDRDGRLEAYAATSQESRFNAC